MIQAIVIAAIVTTGIVSIVGIICYAVLRDGNKVGGKSKVSPAVQAARDNLEMSKLGAQRDAIEFERDKIIDARHGGNELPEGLAEKLSGEESKPKPVQGDIVGEQRKKKGVTW